MEATQKGSPGSRPPSWITVSSPGRHGRRSIAPDTKSQKEEMSGVGFLAAVKTFAPGGRRRRRCEKQQKVLELPTGYAMQPDVVPCWDAAPPITPPAAFLPPGYKKGFPGERRGFTFMLVLSAELVPYSTASRET
ncbi:uncharacterized protein LOC143213000 [Lasioglossum baleicum]|uniref:uncharacterized protein LOC143213000 n=1 Tax=Lasioglossum baleicum TaxID=434251 RepID=UPI003FCCC079